MRYINPLIHTGILAILFALPKPAAVAQDALGAGNALDANLNSRGTSNVASQRIDFRRRNLTVTGDVLGGKGFRGNSQAVSRFGLNGVGYRADRDFRGGLSDDTLFRFNADSALSSLNAIRFGTTYQSLRYGRDLGLLEYRRSGRGEAVNNIRAMRLGGDMVEAQTRLDEITRERAGSLIDQRLVASSPLGVTRAADGRELMVTASSLRGIIASPIGGPRGDSLTPFDQARLTEDRQVGRSVPSSSLMNLSQLAVVQDDTRLDQTTKNTRLIGTAEDAYVAVLQRIVDRYAAARGKDVDIQPDLLVGLDRQYDELRQRLSGRFKPQRTGERRPAPRLLEAEIPPDGATPPDENAEGPEATTALPGPDQDRGLDRYGIILRHGATLEHYAAERDDRFNELMRSAEERLQVGDYFWAERRFNRAIRFVPDHPLALAGIIHAQMGAGLYLPAAATLRRMFVRHPEMIDVRYGEAMLPARDRLLRIEADLKERLRRSLDPSSHGFLLAYMGHLNHDPVTMADGLTSLSADPADADFASLLRNVWLPDAP